jgi:phage tail sheath protein FI
MRALLGWLAFVLVWSAPVAFAAPIPLLDIGAAGFVGQTEQGPLDQPVHVASHAEFTATFGASTAGLANPHLAPSVAAYFANGGQDLWVVRTAGADDASLIGGDDGPGARTGLQSLGDVDVLGAVAIPGATTQAVQAALLAHCEAMRWRVAVLDPASATDPNGVIDQRAGLSTMSGHGALYFPWVVAAPTGISQTLPPSGFVAGIFARTSPSVAPAGTGTGAVATATGVSFAVSSTLQNTLNPLGINAIRMFTGQGVVVFGGRTLAGNSDWQYVNVRRMGIAIEKSIERGTTWALLENNDETLWAQLRDDLYEFMHARWAAGWLQGVTPDEAFFVRCDETTMTADDLAAGRTVMLVGFAPLRPNEFLLLRIVQPRAHPTAVPPTAPALSVRSPWPNPAAGRTIMSFVLPRAGAVTMRILDVAGRTVRTLAAREEMAAGAHERSWDGREDLGAPAATGLYFVRVEMGAEAITRRIARVR